MSGCSTAFKEAAASAGSGACSCQKVRVGTLCLPSPLLRLILLLQGGSSQEDAEEFLSLTQQLAVSSAYGAVQCSYGACLSMQQHGGGSGGQQQPQQQPDVVLLARLEEAPQLQRFLECPPVAALLEVGAAAPACLFSGTVRLHWGGAPSLMPLALQNPSLRTTTCRATSGCRCARCGAARCRPPPATAAPAVASSSCLAPPPSCFNVYLFGAPCWPSPHLDPGPLPLHTWIPDWPAGSHPGAR